MEKARTTDVKRLSEQLRISRNATYEAIKRGEIPAIRVGRRLLVPADWLDRKLKDIEAGSAIPIPAKWN